MSLLARCFQRPASRLDSQGHIHLVRVMAEEYMLLAFETSVARDARLRRQEAVLSLALRPGEKFQRAVVCGEQSRVCPHLVRAQRVRRNPILVRRSLLWTRGPVCTSTLSLFFAPFVINNTCQDFSRTSVICVLTESGGATNSSHSRAHILGSHKKMGCPQPFFNFDCASL